LSNLGCARSLKEKPIRSVIPCFSGSHEHNDDVSALIIPVSSSLGRAKTSQRSLGCFACSMQKGRKAKIINLLIIAPAPHLQMLLLSSECLPGCFIGWATSWASSLQAGRPNSPDCPHTSVSRIPGVPRRPAVAPSPPPIERSLRGTPAPSGSVSRCEKAGSPCTGAFLTLQDQGTFGGTWLIGNPGSKSLRILRVERKV
jgi:hypothetical protein